MRVQPCCGRLRPWPAQRLKAPATLDEFLAWEEQQPERYEFLDGVVRMMTGGTEDHDRLSVNLISLLANALRGGPCSVHASNLKVVSRAGNASMYPGAVRALRPAGGQADPDRGRDRRVEVLSPRTAKDDLTRKRRAYTALPTMRVVVYVSQDEPRLDLVRRRADGGFDDEVVEGLDAVLELPEIGVRLAMAEIYEDTEVARTAAGGGARGDDHLARRRGPKGACAGGRFPAPPPDGRGGPRDPRRP